MGCIQGKSKPRYVKAKTFKTPLEEDEVVSQPIIHVSKILQLRMESLMSITSKTQYRTISHSILMT